MGRGQTATDSSSHVFGNRRGAGLPCHIPERDDRSPHQATFDQLGHLGVKVLLAFSHLEKVVRGHSQRNIIRCLGGRRNGVSKAISALLSLGLIERANPDGASGDPFYALTDEGRAVIPDAIVEDDFLERSKGESSKMAPKPLRDIERQVLAIFMHLGDQIQIAAEIKRTGWNYMAPMRRLKEAGQEVPSRQQVSQIMRRLEERGFLKGRLDATNLRLYVITDEGRAELTRAP